MTALGRTLQVDGGRFLRGALRTSLACLLTLAALEAAARTPWAASHLPTRSLGTQHRMFDRKLSNFERFLAREGGLDCMLVGTSAVNHLTRTSVIESAYEERTGRTMRCYDFSIQGITPAGLAAVTPILVELYRPSLLIWGTGATDFFQSDPKIEWRRYRLDRIRSSPWYRYHSGDVTIAGWMATNSRVVGLAADLFGRIGMASPDEREDSRKRAHRDGTRERETSHAKDVARGEAMRKRWDRGVKHARISPEVLASSDPIFLLQSRLTLVLVALPINQATRADLSPETTAALRTESERFSRWVAQRGVPYWREAESGVLGDDDWRDFVHANPQGGKKFSRWLGHRLGDAVLSGEIPDPADGSTDQAELRSGTELGAGR